MLTYRLLLFFALCFASCESNRIAGTEVGNPELTVSARFIIIGNNDSLTLTDMQFKCMGMAYHSNSTADSMLWNMPAGNMVNLAESSLSENLKPITIKSDSWNKAEMFLNTPLGNSSLPDTTDFKNWTNPRYAKIIKLHQSEEQHYLFEMPQGMRIKLMFDKPTISSWIKKDTMAITIPFDAVKWFSVLMQEPALQSRKDGLGMDYHILSSTENTKTYNQLKSMLPQCFKSDSTVMF